MEKQYVIKTHSGTYQEAAIIRAILHDHGIDSMIIAVDGEGKGG